MSECCCGAEISSTGFGWVPTEGCRGRFPALCGFVCRPQMWLPAESEDLPSVTVHWDPAERDAERELSMWDRLRGAR